MICLWKNQKIVSKIQQQAHSLPFWRFVRGIQHDSLSGFDCPFWWIVSEGDSKSSAFNRAPMAQYRYALMRHLDPSLVKDALRMKSDDSDVDMVNFEVANRHHEEMMNALSKHAGLEIIHLPSDGYPDSVFIEDTVVVVDDVALLTRPGAESRKGEVERVRQVLDKSSAHGVSRSFPSLNLFQVDEGTLDGGDVLFTGREFYVGLSHRTNMEGIKSLAKVFPSFRVTAVDITNAAFSLPGQLSPLHLKSMCSRGGDRTLILGGYAGSVLSRIVHYLAPDVYDLVEVPDMSAANCIWVNGVLIRPLRSEMSKDSSLLLDNLGGRHVEVATSELAKLDGAISCCSVLIQ